MQLTLSVVLQGDDGELRILNLVVDRPYSRAPIIGEGVAFADHPDSLDKLAMVASVVWMPGVDPTVPSLLLKPYNPDGQPPTEEQLRAWGYTSKDDAGEEWPWPGVEPFTLG